MINSILRKFKILKLNYSDRKKGKYLGLTFILLLASIFGITIFNLISVGATPNIGVNTTWNAAGSPYLITTNFDINPGVTLTIDTSGGNVEVVYQGNYYTRIYGALNTTGGNQVIFRNSNASSTSTNQWQGLKFYTSTLSSSLNNVTIKNSNIAIQSFNSTNDVSFSNSTFQYNIVGIESYNNGRFTSTNNTYANITNFAIVANPESLDDISFSGDNHSGMTNSYPNSIGFAYSNSSIAPTCPSNICQINTANLTINGESLPRDYVAWNDSFINFHNNTYEFGPGVVVKARGGNTYFQFASNSVLDVNGASGNPAVFTTVHDSAYGQDVNTTVAFDRIRWRGFVFTDSSVSTIDYAVIRSARDLMYVQVSATATFTNTILEQSAVGFRNFGGTITVNNSTVRNITAVAFSNIEGYSFTITNNTVENIGIAAFAIEPNALHSTTISGNNLTNTNSTYSNSIIFGYDDFSFTNACPSNVCQITTARLTINGESLPRDYVAYRDSFINFHNNTYEFGPGVVVKARGGNTYFQFSSNSVLDVNGVSGNPAVFTTIHDSAYGRYHNNSVAFDRIRWRGFVFTDSSVSTIDYAVIRSVRDIMQVQVSATATFTNTILEQSAIGFRNFGGTITVNNSTVRNITAIAFSNIEGYSFTITNNTVENIGIAPFAIEPNALHTTTISGNNLTNTNSTYSNSIIFGYDDVSFTNACPSNVCQITTARLTINGESLPRDYVAWNDSFINFHNNTYAFGPGVVVKARGGNTYFQFSSNSVLDVNGVFGNPVVFTTIHDSAYGRYHNNSVAFDRIRWRGFVFTDSSVSTIDYAVIRSVRDIMQVQVSATATFTNTILEQSAIGFRNFGGTITVNNSTVRDITAIAFSNIEGYSFTITNNTVENIGIAPFAIEPNALHSTTISGNNLTNTNSTYSNSIIFGYDDFAYGNACPSNVCQITTARLTINGESLPRDYIAYRDSAISFFNNTYAFGPGVVVKARGGNTYLEFTTNSVFNVNGIAGTPTVFTTIYDSAYGRYHNNSVAFDGIRWRGFILTGNSFTNINYAVIRSMRDLGLQSQSTNATSITNTLFDSTNIGIRVNSASGVSLSQINFINTGAFALQNLTTNVVTAENLYWGDSSGPNDTNAGGQHPTNLTSGGNITDTATNPVDYIPYSTSPFSFAGGASQSQLNANGKNAGYYTKVIEKPDGKALINYIAEVGNQTSVSTAYDNFFASCQNTNCTEVITTVDPGGYGQTRPASDGIPGAWGLLYIRNSTGLPVYISNNPGNNGRDMRPLFATDSNFSNATMGSPVYSNTEPIMFISGVVRNDFTPFLVFERLNVGNLESFSCSNDGCSAGTFRSLVNGATRPSVTKLTDGRPVISFYKSGTNDLGLYVCSDTACTSGTVSYPATTGAVGQYNNVILRADGTPGIAYSTSTGLHFIDCDNANCTTFTNYSTHDEPAVMGQNLSVPMMALDENDNPIILSRSARGKGTGNLNYYTCYNPECSEGRFRTLVENENDIGLYASILRKSDGTLIIPYKDDTNKTTQLFAGIPSGSSNVINVDSNLDVVQVSRQNTLNPVAEEFGDPQVENFSTAVVDIRVEKASGDIPIADVVMTYPENSDIDFTAVTGDSDVGTGKSVISNLTSLSETNSTHTLYIPRNPGVNGVRICPDANILSEVTLDCNSGYELDPERHSIVSIVTIGGNEYFRVLGLTGTGGLGIVAGTPAMRIDLENEVPSASADTEIWFATPTDITANTTIQVSYDINFTGGSLLTASDITVTCDGDGLSPITGTGMTTFSLVSTSEGYLEVNTGTDSCSEWMVIDINGGGGNHLTNPTTPGNYSFSVIYDVSSTGTPTAQGATLAYIQHENDVLITAYVPPVIDMQLYEANNDTLLNGTGANTCELGVLSINTVSTCVYDIGTGTNNLAGLSIHIQSDGELRDGAGNTISACSGINCGGLGGAGVTAGEEEYGIYISDLGSGEYTAANSFGTQHQAITLTQTLFASTNSTGSGTTTGSVVQRLEVTHAVSISLATVQGSYSHVVSFRAFSN